jgi:hypothetical protein
MTQSPKGCMARGDHSPLGPGKIMSILSGEFRSTDGSSLLWRFRPLPAGVVMVATYVYF